MSEQVKDDTSAGEEMKRLVHELEAIKNRFDALTQAAGHELTGVKFSGFRDDKTAAVSLDFNSIEYGGKRGFIPVDVFWGRIQAFRKDLNRQGYAAPSNPTYWVTDFAQDMGLDPAVDYLAACPANWDEREAE